MTYLPYRFISVTGPDAEKFLQGQSTCDLTQLSDDHISYGTVNTPKGRMYGLFLIARIENGFLLRLHQSTAEHVAETLSKYKVFFKCEMKQENEWRAYGHDESDLSLPPYCLSRNDAELCMRLPGTLTCYEIWRQESTETAANQQGDSESQDALEKWHCMQSLNGIPELYSETQDQFILQYLNLHKLNAVSFNKGCYTGQEIIARMKFLGKLKKGMFSLTSEHKLVGTPGQLIYDSEGKKCGELVRSHWHQDHGSVALGILDLSYSENDKPVFLEDTASHPFTVEEIVYN